VLKTHKKGDALMRAEFLPQSSTALEIGFFTPRLRMGLYAITRLAG